MFKSSILASLDLSVTTVFAIFLTSGRISSGTDLTSSFTFSKVYVDNTPDHFMEVVKEMRVLGAQLKAAKKIEDLQKISELESELENLRKNLRSFELMAVSAVTETTKKAAAKAEYLEKQLISKQLDEIDEEALIVYEKERKTLFTDLSNKINIEAEHIGKMELIYLLLNINIVVNKTTHFVEKALKKERYT